MIETASETETTTLEVMHGNRRFPMLAESKHVPPENRIRELRVQPVQKSLPDRLAAVIFSELPWSDLNGIEKPDRETVVRAYIDSLKKLDTYRQEAETFIAEACRANLEFRQGSGETHDEARGEVMDLLLSRMIEDGTAPWDPVRNIATAELLTKSPQYYQQQFENALSTEAARFSFQFVELLKHFVDKELFGLVEWLPVQCCRYHFFRRVAIQGESRVTESRSESITHGFLDNPRWPIVGHAKVTKTENIPHEIRYARHEHELINAIRTSVANSSVVMPDPVLRMIQCVPTWLVQFVEVIEGHIIRERIIERDVATEDWTKVSIRDEPIYHTDPGIVIGPYVVCGWILPENQDDQATGAVADEAYVSDTKGLAIPMTMIAGGLTVFALWHLHDFLSKKAGSLMPAILSSAIAAALVGMVTFLHARRRRYRDPRHYAELMATVFALCLILVGLAIAKTFVPVDSLFPIIAGGLIVVFVSLSRGCR